MWNCRPHTGVVRVARHHVPLQVRAEAQAFAAEGLSSRAIARRLGIHRATVDRWLRKQSVEVKPEPEDQECRHTAFTVPGRQCLACGVEVSPPPLAERDSSPPEWARQVPEDFKAALKIGQPSWHKEE